mgnify:FL=1
MDIGLQRLTIRAQQTTASTRLAGTCLLLLDLVDACDFAEVSEQEIRIPLVDAVESRGDRLYLGYAKLPWDFFLSGARWRGRRTR